MAGTDVNTRAVDNFDRPNEVLNVSAIWDSSGGYPSPSIVSNKVQASTTDQGCYCVGYSFADDQWVEFDVSLTGTTGYGGAAAWLRRTADNAFYAVEWHNGSSGTIILNRVTPGAGWETIGTAVTSAGLTGKLRFEVVGSQLTVYKDGVEVITQTDTTHSTGRPGFHVFYQTGTPVTIDNFKAGDWRTFTPPKLKAFSKSTEDVVYNNGATIVVANSFSWVAGDVIVAMWGTENATGTITLDNETNLTFTPVSAMIGSPGSSCAARLYYAIASGPGSGTISGVKPEVTSVGAELCAWHWTGSEGIGNMVPADITASAGPVPPSTPTQNMGVADNSAVITGWFDWEATASTFTGEPNTGILGERLDNVHTGAFSMWAGDWIGTTAGVDGWGTTSGTGLTLTFPGTIEILGTPVDVVAADNFNRSNGALGSNWSAPNFTISGNDVSASAGASSAIWTANTVNNDQWAEVDVTLGTDDSGIILRQVDANNHYFGFWTTASSGSYQIWKFVGGSPSQIASAAAGATSGTKRLRMEVVGSKLTLYANGVEVVTVTDTAHASGSVGMWAGDTTAIFDNFSAGDWTFGAAPVIINPPGSYSTTASGTAALTVTGANPITDYIVQYRTTSGPGAWQTFTDAVSATTGASVTALSPGVSYDFRVSAVNAFGRGLWSNITTVVAGSGGVVIKLKLGDTQVSAIKLGDTAVNKAYLGDTLVVG
jgi:Fibronectin type III domain